MLSRCKRKIPHWSFKFKLTVYTQYKQILQNIFKQSEATGWPSSSDFCGRERGAAWRPQRKHLIPPTRWMLSCRAETSQLSCWFYIKKKMDAVLLCFMSILSNSSSAVSTQILTFPFVRFESENRLQQTAQSPGSEMWRPHDVSVIYWVANLCYDSTEPRVRYRTTQTNHHQCDLDDVMDLPEDEGNHDCKEKAYWFTASLFSRTRFNLFDRLNRRISEERKELKLLLAVWWEVGWVFGRCWRKAPCLLPSCSPSLCHLLQLIAIFPHFFLQGGRYGAEKWGADWFSTSSRLQSGTRPKQPEEWSSALCCGKWIFFFFFFSFPAKIQPAGRRVLQPWQASLPPQQCNILQRQYCSLSLKNHVFTFIWCCATLFFAKQCNEPNVESDAFLLL